MSCSSTAGQREFQAVRGRISPRRGSQDPRRVTTFHLSGSHGRRCMSKELVISTSRHETRVAILEDDQVVEVYHQRENEYSLAGSIHKGRVTRVLPGMQSAFVDIGQSPRNPSG